uniref:Uncharacterized protein n=1 Tax=Pseudo-nitzschia australis TaxID=44445 RepID=A0A7S4AER4_9STRA
MNNDNMRMAMTYTSSLRDGSMMLLLLFHWRNTKTEPALGEPYGTSRLVYFFFIVVLTDMIVARHIHTTGKLRTSVAHRGGVEDVCSLLVRTILFLNNQCN